uniref:Uncharacterized protein n=1 Tax=Lepeophtheirus salmonis TaxID=72036 RepID=A0A0K2U745_LEPSM
MKYQWSQNTHKSNRVNKLCPVYFLLRSKSKREMLCSSLFWLTRKDGRACLETVLV